MKKIIAILAVIVVIAVFVVFQKIESPQDDKKVITKPTSQALQTTTPTVKYKDGTYTGNSVAASQYGNIQVKVIISGGKITDVQFLQFPNTPGHTTEVSTSVMPVLKQETIAAQSSNVDLVSGATQTTEGFIQTLQSALDQAVI